MPTTVLASTTPDLLTTETLPGPGGHAWLILTVLLVLAVVTSLEPRMVPRDRWLVVLRSGRVDRVVAGGLALRMPALESYVWLPKGPTRRPFVVNTRSSEGVEVRISGELELLVTNPAEAVDNACSPLDRAQDEAEHALARTVSRCDVTALAELPAYLELPIAVPGVHVAPLDLETVELALSPHTLRAVSHPK